MYVTSGLLLLSSLIAAYAASLPLSFDPALNATQPRPIDHDAYSLNATIMHGIADLLGYHAFSEARLLRMKATFPRGTTSPFAKPGSIQLSFDASPSDNQMRVDIFNWEAGERTWAPPQTTAEGDLLYFPTFEWQIESFPLADAVECLRRKGLVRRWYAIYGAMDASVATQSIFYYRFFVYPDMLSTWVDVERDGSVHKSHFWPNSIEVEVP